MRPAPGQQPSGSHHPQRSCVSCRRTRDKKDLVRVAHHRDVVVADFTQTHPGRGSYVCPTVDCVDRALERDAARMRTSLRGGPTNQVQRALKTIREHLASAEHHKEHHA